jgi:plastocyanin
MPRLRLRLLGSITVVAATIGLTGSASAATQHESTIAGFSYSPNPLVVTVGDSVRWRNVPPNADHSATVDATPSNSFEFDTGLLAPNTSSAPILLTTVGTFTVYCSLHGISMSQQLVVNAAPPAEVPEAALPVLFGASALTLCGLMLLGRRRWVRPQA